MKNRSFLHGLGYDQSCVAVWKLLFSPSLLTCFNHDWTFAWSQKLIEHHLAEREEPFADQYKELLIQVKPLLSLSPRCSLQNPPWSMISLDMRIGMIPWVTPVFEVALWMLFTNGAAFENHFGKVLPFAFFQHGGPGDCAQSAFRVCAPTGWTRASAEHWLMRAYLRRSESGSHFTLAPDAFGRTFSMHHYKDENGVQKSIFFETTASLGREEEDFQNFLHQGNSLLPRACL